MTKNKIIENKIRTIVKKILKENWMETRDSIELLKTDLQKERASLLAGIKYSMEQMNNIKDAKDMWAKKEYAIVINNDKRRIKEIDTQLKRIEQTS